MKARILVTGGGGMLALDLKRALEAAGWDVTAPKRAQLDITNRAHLGAVMATLKPAAVINCAAFTKVDLCETDPRASEVNDVAVGTVAEAAARHGGRLVHVSTDFVFDGRKARPYTEEDEPRPLSAYGSTKRAGEIRALEAPESLVVRASWLFGSHGPNFVEAMLRQAEEGKTAVRVVTDQTGRPTATTDLADALVDLLRIGATGIFHFANHGAVSWNDFAQEIFRQAGRPDVAVESISSADLRRPARRPPYSVLDTEKYESRTGRRPRDFREPLAEYLARRRH